MPQTVLLVEDNTTNAALVETALCAADGRFVVHRVRKCSEAQDRLRTDHERVIAAVITNLFLPDSQGLDTIARIFEVFPHAPVLVLTTADNESVAKQAMQLGAQDYVLQHRLDKYFLPKILQNMLYRAANAEARLEINRPTQYAPLWNGETAHDQLTHLPNPLLLYDRLSQAIASARRQRRSLAVLCVHIDHFKHVNYALGREIGDQLLRSVAERLTAGVRASDTVSRHGGNEFVVMLPEVGRAEDAARSAEKIIAMLGAPHRIDRHDLQIGVTIGIVVFPDDGGDAATLIKNATTAASRAKRQIPDSYEFFKPHMNELSIERRFMECALRRVLDRQELVLYYQPQVDLQSEAIIGAEALIRWSRPPQAKVLPTKFIPATEWSGSIGSIGLWALREACNQARNWRDANLPPIRVTIKVSTVELRSIRFVENVREILQQTGVNSECLEFGIAEAALAADCPTTAAVLHALRDMGVQVALDRFGTGISSLTDLKRYPLCALKIDESLVQGLCADPDDHMVDAVISAARSLRLRVTARGIEQREQLWALQRLRCDEGQGRYFRGPLSASEFAGMMKAAPAAA